MSAMLLCAGCGIKVPDPNPPRDKFTKEERTAWGIPKIPKQQPRRGRCEECRARRTAAEEYVAEHPVLARRLGGIAVDAIENVMIAHHLLNQPVPDDLAFTLPRLWPISAPLNQTAAQASSKRGLQPEPGQTLDDLFTEMGAPRVPAASLALGAQKRPNDEPWSHVTASQRHELRKAHAAVMRDRLALDEPPTPIRCPMRACVLCGVLTVKRSALEVLRRGGLAATTAAVWTKVRAGQIDGYACPDCHRAITAVGAVGQAAVMRAVTEYLKAQGKENEARRLKVWVAEEVIGSPRAWARVRGAKPNSTPWDHMLSLLERLEEPKRPVPVGPIEVIPAPQ